MFLLPSASFHPMLDIVDVRGPNVPGIVPVPTTLLFMSRVLCDIQCTYCWREEYRDILTEERAFRSYLWGVVLDATLGSCKSLQIAAQVILIMRRAIEVSKKVHAVSEEWNKLLVVWMTPYPTNSSEPASQTEGEFWYEQIAWKVSTLYEQIIPLATALWELSISYCLLIKAFGTTPEARSQAVKTLFVNLSEGQRLLKELGENEPLVEKILKFFYIQTPAKEWITQLDQTLKTVYKIDEYKETTTMVLWTSAGSVWNGAKKLAITFINPANA